MPRAFISATSGSLEHARDDFVRRRDRKRHVGGDHFRPHEPRRELGDVPRRVVLVRADQDLVVLIEIERAQDRVHAGRGIRYECDAFRVGADERGELRAGVVEQRLELAHHEAHRLALELRAVFVLFRQHRDRGRTERAVVEIRDRWIEQPMVFHKDEG